MLFRALLVGLLLCVLGCENDQRWGDLYMKEDQKDGSSIYHVLTCPTFGQKGMMSCPTCDMEGFKEMCKKVGSKEVSDSWLRSDSFFWFHTKEDCTARVIAIPAGSKPCKSCIK